MVTSEQQEKSIIKTGMPAKLNIEIVAAAIAGFQEQKKRIDAQIEELRNLQGSTGADGSGGRRAIIEATPLGSVPKAQAR